MSLVFGGGSLGIVLLFVFCFNRKFICLNGFGDACYVHLLTATTTATTAGVQNGLFNRSLYLGCHCSRGCRVVWMKNELLSDNHR